jgi:hypothetical protein
LPLNEDELHARRTVRFVPERLGGRLDPERAVEVPVPALPRLRHREPRPAGHGLMSVLTEAAGDDRFSWDPADFAQIHEAKRFFDEMVGQGMVPHAVGRDGRPGATRMTEFDPAAGEILFTPARIPRAVVGG